MTLRVDVPPDGLEIELVNGLAGATGPARGGRGPVAGLRAASGGRGLDGMRERVLLLGGRITAGPADGRWRVRVQLPTPRGSRDDHGRAGRR
ncbi:hypothetical protein [Micromonospora sp. DT47]|uniref:hypothetical protein n=1 Tax=Micromonospora sp. DT47 TaxID=3393431 RepID=UPI003CF414FA